MQDGPAEFPITDINLKLLQTFVLVAETKSFREAADYAHRSQSAVSLQIKQLEEQLGVELLSRTTRKVKLTPEGEELLVSVSRALHEVRTGLARIREVEDFRRGNVSLGCSPTIASTQLPRILAAFEATYPQLRVQVRELKASDLVEALRKGELHFGISPVVEGPDLDCEVIITDRIFAMVPRKLLPDARATIPLRQLAELPILQLHPTTQLSRMLEDAAKHVGVTLNIRYRCMHAQTLVALADAGIGAAILRESVIETAHAPATRGVLITEPVLTQTFALVKLRGVPLTPVAERLADIIRRHIIPRARGRGGDDE